MDVSRILLVEDNEADIFLVRRALEQQQLQHSLEVLRNGEDALAYIRSADAGAAEERPHLILLDLNLPRVDGTQVLTRIRATQELHTVPVILLTSSTSPRDRETVLALGATTYFTKPVDLQSFMKLGGVVQEALVAQPPVTQP